MSYLTPYEFSYGVYLLTGDAVDPVHTGVTINVVEMVDQKTGYENEEIIRSIVQHSIVGR